MSRNLFSIEVDRKVRIALVPPPPFYAGWSDSERYERRLRRQQLLSEKASRCLAFGKERKRKRRHAWSLVKFH